MYTTNKQVAIKIWILELVFIINEKNEVILQLSKSTSFAMTQNSREHNKTHFIYK